MSWVLNSFAALLVVQNVPSTNTPEKQYFTVQSQWGFSCPPERIGADGQLLCTATYTNLRLDVERTNGGMKISFVSRCGFNENYPGRRRYKYKNIAIAVSLKQNASPEKIERVLYSNLDDIPKLSKKFCGKDNGNDQFEIDRSQVPNMIEIIFVKKKLPY